jgi:hypothetical protein
LQERWDGPNSSSWKFAFTQYINNDLHELKW